MKKIITLLFTLTQVVLLSTAQTFYDDFSDNRNNWVKYNKSEAWTTFGDGLQIKQNSSKFNAYITKNFSNAIDDIEEVECSFIKYSGATGIGLIWNFKGEETHNRFIITPRDQQFFIQYRVDNNKQEVKAWTTSTAINKGVANNVLKLKAVNNSIQYYINGTLVHTQGNSKLSQNNIGILLGSMSGANCKINYFKVKGQTQEIVNYPPEIVITEPDISRGFKVVEQKSIKVAGRAIDNDGISQVKVNGYGASLQSGGYFSVYVPISTGNNTIVVEATDTKMKTSYKSFDVSGGTTNTVVNKPVTQKRIALVIGNSQYMYGGKLLNPTNDARAMKTTLEQLGFTVMKYENCNQATLKKAIDDFGSKLKDYDVGLFFYAGHGVQFDGRNYLIPIDARLENKNDVDYDCVRAGRILAKMESAGTKTNIVILDACRNNPFERSWSRGAESSGLAFMNAPSGSLIAYATSPGMTASDGNGQNGLYTSALLKCLKMPNLTIEEVFKEVRQTVMKESGGKQTPWESTSLIGNFYFKN